MIIACNQDRGLLIFDGVPTVKYHPTRAPFAGIAPACGSYTVDSYTDSTITITHDDPALSGTYTLDLDPTVRDQAIPHVAEIRRVMRAMMRLSYLNVKPAARVPVDDAEYIADADVIKFAKAIWGIVQIAVEDDDE
ncbi:MAG: hypothetical protein DRJ65_00165 [Acidobacteria bacterium]|nr:MAG: hypothetical protein DRJ65_00165 [Acidobacteriota bacterium]